MPSETCNAQVIGRRCGQPATHRLVAPDHRLHGEPRCATHARLLEQLAGMTLQRIVPDDDPAAQFAAKLRAADEAWVPPGPPRKYTRWPMPVKPGDRIEVDGAIWVVVVAKPSRVAGLALVELEEPPSATDLATEATAALTDAVRAATVGIANAVCASTRNQQSEGQS